MKIIFVIYKAFCHKNHIRSYLVCEMIKTEITKNKISVRNKNKE